MISIIKKWYRVLHLQSIKADKYLAIRPKYSKKTFFLFVPLVLFFPSCSSAPVMIQPQVNSLVASGKHKYALSLLENNEKSYGEKNQLLYHMDYGLTLQRSGNYQESIKALKQAKTIYEELYTVSVSNEAVTWLINDQMATFRAEDFERILMNVIQAVNYAVLGNISQALVEARDVHRKLTVINRSYRPKQKNLYRDDAFARMFMGILYESSGKESDRYDALIEYEKAVQIYEKDYKKNYKTETPNVLKENILALSDSINSEKFLLYQNQFPGVYFLKYSQKTKKSQVYIIRYKGLSPIKHQAAIPVPLPGGLLGKLAFPQYDSREVFNRHKEKIKAVRLDGDVIESDLEIGENIEAIAMSNLKRRQKRVVAKALVRQAGKLFFERAQQRVLEEKHSKETSQWFGYFSSLYNLVSEQADLRSWQTLPAYIEISRLILDPGEYKLLINENLIERVILKQGEVKFLLVP